ncbi:hypothetical protein [Paenibacillus pseudetheri]|uniref:Uncharacterized protein n=1 Tax=Paenibacillus pseudetheri TaxID=2897682 RepID=A0ABN8FSV1_9BACL|nr:hypothetical protein [Paenibacillus pseudetheri]CAH1059594.1 hypothetical protein PAECIP111894_05806 [Paenibacillus pseudetheri]
MKKFLKFIILAVLILSIHFHLLDQRASAAPVKTSNYHNSNGRLVYSFSSQGNYYFSYDRNGNTLGKTALNNIVIRTDDLNNWDQTYYHTNSLYLDESNAAYFDNDHSRAARTMLTDDEIVWKQTGLKVFQAITYSNNKGNYFDYFTSVNGMDWDKALPTVTVAQGSGGWSKHSYTLAPLTGANYVKIRWNNREGEIWSPQISKVIMHYEENVDTLTDELSDFSMTYSRSDNLYFDSSNPLNFNNDFSRVMRTSLTSEEIVWRKDGMVSFQARTFFYPENMSHFKIYTSFDGVNWRLRVPDIIEGEQYEDWPQIIYALDNLEDTNFVKIVWTGSEGYFWTPQITKVLMNYKTGMKSMTDNVSDWSRSLSHTGNLWLDNSNLSFFDNDTSRIMRTQFTDEEVIWKHDKIRSFHSVVYKDESEGGTLEFYISANGTEWSRKIPQVVRLGKTADWTKYTYSLHDLSNVNYLKIKWSGNKENLWSPQVSSVTINHL